MKEKCLKGTEEKSRKVELLHVYLNMGENGREGRGYNCVFSILLQITTNLNINALC